MSAAVEVRDLTVRYGEVVALDGADVRIESGRICALLGVNGSGKTTLLKSIVGLVRPARGSVRIHGDPPSAARRRAAVGYVPQSEDIDWDFPLSVRDVVMLGRYGHLGPARRPRVADRAATDAALDRLGLGELAGRQIGRLSGGQRKRVFVARGLAQEATVLLLDEPFAGVDIASQEIITELLRELAAQGRTVVVSTHDLHGLPALADEAILFARRVLLHADPATVLRPENLARAFGMPEGGHG